MDLQKSDNYKSLKIRMNENLDFEVIFIKFEIFLKDIFL
jgi:hypothetical protein